MRTYDLRRIRQSVRESTLAVVDQCVVSLASFALTVMLGRVAGPTELALYSLAATLLIVVATVQDSLISVPYTVYGARLEEHDRAEYTGCSLVFCGGLALVASAALALGGALALTGVGPDGLGRLLVVAAIFLPGLVLREFARRVSAADLRIETTLALDVSVFAVQGVGLVWLATRDVLSASNALGLAGLASASGALTWLVVRSRQGRIRACRARLGPAWREHWSLGRWVVASRIVGHLSSDALLLWVLTFALGASSAGAFAACLTVAFLTNPLVLGVGLFLTPRLAADLAAGGLRSVARHVRGTTAILAVLLGIFVAGVAASGEWLLRLAYGSEYAGLGTAATVTALAVALGALSVGATSALLVLERPAVNLVASLLGLVTMLASAAILIPAHGIVGAGLSLCVGNSTQLLVRLALFARVVTRHPDRQPAPGDLLEERQAT